MKILCNLTPCGPAYVRAGWGRVFSAIGHEFRFWQPDTMPAFDAFAWNPDLYIGTTYEVDRAVEKNIVARPEMKVILFASAWGPYLKDVDLKKYPIVVVTEQEKRIIDRLKKTTGKPDFVFIHAHDRWLDGTMSGWKDIGVDYQGILNAADVFVYLNGQRRPELVCDVAFVGGYWGYKARNIDRFLLPLCHAQGLNVKIFGNRQWPVSQYLGTIEDSDVNNLFVSAAVCPNVSEPHSTDFGWDVVERPMKVWSSGGFCVSDYVEEAAAMLPDMPFVHSGAGMEKMVRHFIHHPEDRLPIMEKCKRKVLDSHTYFDRVSQFFDALGMPKESAKCHALKAKVLQG